MGGLNVVSNVLFMATGVVGCVLRLLVIGKPLANVLSSSLLVLLY